MDWRDVIDKSELGEPYASMDFLNIGEIHSIEKKFRGEQIRFKKNCGSIMEEYREFVKIIGKEKTVMLVKMFSGEPVYFPKIKRTCLQKVWQLIKDDFDGSNYKKLSKKYGYCERHIRRIVKNTRRETPRDERQISISDIIKNF